MNTFPAEAQFAGGVVTILDQYGNLGSNPVGVGKRVGLLSEETTEDFTVEISIVCAKP